MSGPSFSFVVPGAPVPKARVRVFRSKKTGKPHGVTPKRTENFEALVRLVASSARPAKWPLRCHYRVQIGAYRARRGRGDCSNIAKAIEDACNTVLWADDERIFQLHVHREEDPANPRTVVNVTAFPVKCSRAACTVTTLYPDDDGRCDACPVQHRKRRT